MASLKSSSSVNFKIKRFFFNFGFNEELLRFKVSCEYRILGSLFFILIVICVGINTFSMIILIQNYLSRYKLHPFGVPDKLKAIKKPSSGLTGEFIIKK